jgi:hypothetical protein
MNNIDDDKYNSKKCLTNTITYIINKKMKTYNDKLEILKQKIDQNLEISMTIIKTLKDENIYLQQKMNEKIDTLILSINELRNEKYILKEEFKNNDIMNQCDIINKSEIINESDIINQCDIVNQSDSINHNNKNKILKDKISKDKISKNNITENNSIINEESIIFNYKEIKRESYLLDVDFIKESLHMSNINGDIEIFKKVYINNIPKEYYPIRHIKKKIQYWLNGSMNDDDSIGTYIKNTIIKNIEECYLRVNNYDNNINDIDQFLKNQEHINKLREDKYKDKLLLKIISIITI